jgi:hypothetical protein
VTKSKNHTLYAHWVGPKGNKKTISRAEYNRIKNGMSYSDVKFIVGSGGQGYTRSGDYMIVNWYGDTYNRNGANAVVDFYLVSDGLWIVTGKAAIF